ncbi:LysR family transcriptional regulator [Rahnella ecdela]|uniref:LysR family transcriptional regulator n=1 Tax=Rahnella ecdela TaxID=2816250 RepID=A0ABS6LDL9_9GAMM|nr:LysR family transcriptional regulator [Rahnella ecdela]MBU9845033.1 LysR family transcriptional regulator [Rahnella ecdela]
MTSYFHAELRLLKIFETVIRLKNMKDAAISLNISSSSVSYAIKKMRIIYSDVLFIRINKQFTPTLFALKLHSEIQPMLHSADAGTLRDYAPLHSYPLVISTTDFVANNVIPLTFNLAKEQNIVGIRLVPLPTSRVMFPEVLLDNSVDVIFDYEPVYHPQILFRKLFKEEVCIICSKDHPRFSQSINYKNYISETHAVLEEQHLTKEWSTNGGDNLLPDVNIGFCCNNYIDLLSVVEITEMICIIPMSVFLKLNMSFAIKILNHNFGSGFKEPNVYMNYRKNLHEEDGKDIVMKLLKKMR